jgi:hypothetical protein
MTTTPTTAQTLAAEGIADYAQDLRQLSAAELRGLFAFASSGKINTTRVIKNLIWQAYTAIRDGRRPPIAGNLRSFWYNHFACEAGRRLGSEALRAAVAAVCNAPRAPAGVNPDLIEDAPDTPGAYLLYDAQGAALFAGRAANLRTQLLAHFSARGRHAQEQRQALQAGAVEWFSTAGELGAALHQLRALETLEPRHNRPHRQRREAWALQWRPETAEQPVGVRDLDESAEAAAWDTLYGPFRSRADALAALRGLAREHRLCPTVLGLESQSPCSAHAAGACIGACIGRETRAAHNLRLMQGLLRLRMRPWPYAGAVAIVEQDAARTRTELHVVNAWRHLASVRTEAELQEEYEYDLPTCSGCVPVWYWRERARYAYGLPWFAQPPTRHFQSLPTGPPADSLPYRRGQGGRSIGNSNGLFHRPPRPPCHPPAACPRVPALASVRSPGAAGPGDGSRRGGAAARGTASKLGER